MKVEQIYQLQRQIQDLRQEVNNINQLASQLHHSEANNAAQLQRLQQNETVATQQLQAIQQLCNRLSQDVNVISNVAQQVTSQMMTRPMTSGQFGMGAMNRFSTGVAGVSPSMYSAPNYSPFTQPIGNRNDEFTRNQQISTAAANRYGFGLTTPDYITNQQLSSMASQGMLGSPSNIGTSAFSAGTMSASASPTGFAEMPTGSFSMQPARPVHHGSSSFAGSQFPPMSPFSQAISPMASTTNMGISSF